ncbi:HlyD family secretion protein [Thermonema lapsum]|uniref:HlyD family secretion protein n=1 Tax=Thermonema lapsum TaxID=28195 RepID=A0A846MPD2_9BACT|nr:efflux RND transporter periplasmic adaptor subunit [Thermonema lapsum]NIK73329.1 HlyD family secretion protein [Thermonema lapsum]
MEQHTVMKEKKSRRLKTWHFVVSGVVLVALLIVAQRAGWIGKKSLTEVEIAAVQRTTIVEKVAASGKIQPEAEVKVSSEVSGEIIELTVQEGDSVVKGQLLVRLRPDLLQASVDRARAALQQQQAQLMQARARESQAKARYLIAKANYERNQKLYAEKVISDLEYEQSKTDYEVAKEEYEAAKSSTEASQYAVASARATLKEAQDNLRRTTIYAPTSGIVSLLNVEMGERVVGTAQMAGTELLRIANLNNMEVRVDVNENDIVKVSLGDTATIEIDAFMDVETPIRGVVTSIANTAKQSATADAVTEFEVRIRILPESINMLRRQSGKRYPLRPGMTASVEIITNRKENVVAVPIAAATTRLPSELKKAKGQTDKPNKEKQESDNKAGNQKEEPVTVVFVYKDGKVEARIVETGISDFDNIEIVKGLKEGEQIVVAPFVAISKLLTDGKEVKVKGEGSKNKADKGKKENKQKE